MDVVTKEACLGEISHLICDSDQKVNINEISSKWHLSLRDSESTLLDWLAQNKGRAMAKEYLIRGVDKSGHCVISVVPEKRLPVLERKFTKFSSSLYSLELPTNAPRLGTEQLSTPTMINLSLDAKPRNCIVQPIKIPERVSTPAVKSVKSEDTKKNSVASMFAGSSNKPESNGNAKFEAKPPVDECIEKAVNGEMKEEKKSPKKESPKKKESKTPKIQTGKASIASFFSAKQPLKPIADKKSAPKPSTTTVALTTKSDSVVSSTKPVQNETDHTTNKSTNLTEVSKKPAQKHGSSTIPETSASKRSELEKETKTKKRSFLDICDPDDDDDEVILGTPQEEVKIRKPYGPKKEKSTKIQPTDDDIIPGTPQVSKKPKLSVSRKALEASKQHSRIRRIVDSSDDDDDTMDGATAAGHAVADASERTENKTPPKLAKRNKAKRTVDRTYEDDDGYIVTVKEIEEYSCSDEDVVIVPKKDISPPPVKKATAKKAISVETEEEKSDEKEKTKKTKKATTPKGPVAKQGSILSFFTKK